LAGGSPIDFFKSRFVCSSIIFFVIAVAASNLTQSYISKYAFPDHSYVWWTVSHLRGLTEEEKHPDVAFLGSSLMVSAAIETDVETYGYALDMTLYRRAKFFDQVVEERTGRKNRTLNLASPAQLPSDSYLTLKAAIHEGVRPKVVLYGMAPRDFINGTNVEYPFETACYQYLRRIIATSDIDAALDRATEKSTAGRWLPIPVSWNLLDQPTLRRLFSTAPIMRAAVDLRVAAEVSAADFLSSVMSNLKVASNLAIPERHFLYVRYLLPNFKPLHMVPGALLAGWTYNSKKKGPDYYDNTQAYVERYANPSEAFYTSQMAALQKIVELCNAEHIKLVIINMPIREANASILSSAWRARYDRDLKQETAKLGTTFLDLCDFSRYSKADYGDPVHLNGKGGKKFTDILVSSLMADKILVGATGSSDSSSNSSSTGSSTSPSLPVHDE
jgi:hypothetical protein